MSNDDVVVQGTTPTYNTNPEITQHTKQAKCQDPLFAALFYIDIVGIVVVAGSTGDEWAAQDNTFHEEYQAYYHAAVICGIFGLILSGVGLQIMFCIPALLIKAALIFSLIMSAVMLIFAFIQNNIMGIIFGLIFFALTCCYTWCVWSRIPFATVNLVTAMTAVKANCGITVAAYIFTGFACLWSFVWAVAFYGTFNSVYTCVNEEAKTGCEVSGSGYGYLFLLMLAYFFSHQVIQNTIHVTIAGVVATWWIAPEEASSCCSQAIWDSLKRSLTTSFGSICFGSLLVAIIQALRALANTARSQDDSFLVCLAECILACIESLIEYFNKWAFIYVGIYGMSYCESGSNVMQLFANRGWEAIIADDLVGNTLFLVSLIVGGLTGCVGMIAEAAGLMDEDNPADESLLAFGLGFILGVVLCSILMSVVASAVNAVLVLFAEKPAEFQSSHPQLSQNMREIWSAIYPGSV